jgi:ribonuclease HI
MVLARAILAPGGYGAILLCEGHRKEIYGHEEDTTNGRMELTALVEALKVPSPRVKSR